LAIVEQAVVKQTFVLLSGICLNIGQKFFKYPPLLAADHYRNEENIENSIMDLSHTPASNSGFGLLCQ
jgi:hypothetical protein